MFLYNQRFADPLFLRKVHSNIVSKFSHFNFRGESGNLQKEGLEVRKKGFNIIFSFLPIFPPKLTIFFQ